MSARALYMDSYSIKPFLVHVHIYYVDMYEEIKASLLNISKYKFDIFFTFVKDCPDIFEDIHKNFPSAHIEVVENLGFDVGPFIHVLNKVNLDDYSYIIKVHSKRSFKSGFLFNIQSGDRWRRSLLGFIHDESVFNRVLSNLENNPSIGMHGASNLIFNKYTEPKQTRKAFAEYLKEKNLPMLKYRFVAGTMFMVRAELFKELVALNATLRDFESPDLSHEGCQLAHIYERLFGYFVFSHKMQIVDCTNNILLSKFLYFMYNLFRIVSPYILTVRVTRRNKLLIKFLKIPVFSMSLNKEKNL